jgi:transglutaminase-like putative cysteine protease
MSTSRCRARGLERGSRATRVIAILILGCFFAQCLPRRREASTPPRSATEGGAGVVQTQPALESAVDALARRLDLPAARVDLEQVRGDVEQLNRQAMEDFRRTKQILDERKLPRVFFARHAEAVRLHEAAMAAFEADVAGGDLAKALARLAIARAPRALDPSHLPFRPSGARNAIKPAARGEDFARLAAGPRPVPGGPVTLRSLAVLVPADLAETIEVRFTPRIRALAASLDKDPVRIYEHLKNTFPYEPYYGSLKGADETLAQGAGNDFDLASLLIALLRTSGVPARYALGTIDIPIQRALGWLGVRKAETAADILASAGVPVTALASGGRIAALRLEHVWVEAFVPYENYRGHALSGGKRWIPLDPSWKQLKYTPGPDLRAMMGLDADMAALNAEVEAAATVDRDVPSITSVSESIVGQHAEALASRLAAAVAAAFPGARPQDLIDNLDILGESLGALPASLPYKLAADGPRLAEVPDGARYRVRFQVDGSARLDGAPLAYETTMTELAGRKVTLGYQPATTDDAALLAAQPKLSDTPAYLVEMKPELLVDGEVRANGDSVGLGRRQTLTTTLLLPGALGTDGTTTALVAGSYYAIGLALPKVAKAQLDGQARRFEALAAFASGATATTLHRDDVLGDDLHAVAINYFHNVGAAEDLLSRLSGVALVRQPSLAVTFVEAKVTSLFGVPRTVRPAGLSIDVQRRVVSPFSRTATGSATRAFSLYMGSTMSQHEHVVFERMFNVHAVSTKRLFDVANAAGIPIVALHATNAARVLPSLQVDADVKADVQAAVDAGKIVVLPRQEVSYHGWRGAGYMVLDPVTLASAHRIRGGINGGSTALNEAGESPPLTGSCALGAWSALLDEIDRLLTLANEVLEGKENVSAHAASVCVLLEGIKSELPEDVNKAELILKGFERDVSLMIAAIKGIGQAEMALLALHVATAETLTEALVAMHVFLFSELAKHVMENWVDHHLLEFAGYFIIHYLYEYVVLFSAGLLSAFPEGF